MSISSDLALYAKSISEDLEHGASQILKVAAGSLHTAILKNPNATPDELRAAARDFAIRMVHGQRQMASVLNFSNALLLEVDSSKDGAVLTKELKEYSMSISKSSSDALSRIATHANELIPGTRFMTHSRSSTLFNFFNSIKRKRDLLVYATQSRPGSEGRLLAGELAVAGIRTVLIEDAEAMTHLPDTSALLVGADAIIPSGIVNKVGTRMIAIAARDLGIPVYCLSERIKIWPFDEPILNNLKARVANSKSGDTIFEIIPGSLFDRIVLETGPATFDSISIDRKEITIAPEIRKLVGV
jgi:translation initiation factor 2B subunit (eIF-2B alpha/beta/delta family)